MVTTTKLTDTHLVILSRAARHPEGRVLPLPDGTSNKGGAGTRALKSLLRRQLVQQEIARPEDHEWARGENGQRLTLAITAAGLAAIGVTEMADQVSDGSVAEPVTSSTAPSSASQASEDVDMRSGGSPDPVLRAGTKGAAVVELLRRGEGATLLDLMAVSGWQGHSVRGFLSGTLRKKHGLTVASETAGGIRQYRIVA